MILQLPLANSRRFSDWANDKQDADDFETFV